MNFWVWTKNKGNLKHIIILYVLYNFYEIYKKHFRQVHVQTDTVLSFKLQNIPVL